MTPSTYRNNVFSTPSPPCALEQMCASGNAKGEPQKIHILPSLSHTVSLTDLGISVAWLRFDLYKTYTFGLCPCGSSGSEYV